VPEEACPHRTTMPTLTDEVCFTQPREIRWSLTTLPRWPYCLVFYSNSAGMELLCPQLVRRAIHSQRPRGRCRSHVDQTSQSSRVRYSSFISVEQWRATFGVWRTLIVSCFGRSRYHCNISVRAKGAIFMCFLELDSGLGICSGMAMAFGSY
jgi:hypothetical protein